MYCRGTTPPTILSTNSKPAASGSGSTSMWQMPYSPCPPVCLTFRPRPCALVPMVSRSGTRRLTVSTPTPYRVDRRSSSRSRAYLLQPSQLARVDVRFPACGECREGGRLAVFGIGGQELKAVGGVLEPGQHPAEFLARDSGHSPVSWS